VLFGDILVLSDSEVEPNNAPMYMLVRVMRGWLLSAISALVSLTIELKLLPASNLIKNYSITKVDHFRQAQTSGALEGVDLSQALM
jgi:hypothetical protein